MTEVFVKGLDDLLKVLETLPAKMEQNVMRGALRAGMKEVLAEAKANAAVLSGEMRDGLKISTRARNGRVTASIKAKGKHAYLAHLIEYGTKAHKIFPKNGKALVIRSNSRASSGTAKRWMNIRAAESINHPGIKARPFMRPALDGKAGAALLAMGSYIKKRLAQKHGLDMSLIDLVGDE